MSDVIEIPKAGDLKSGGPKSGELAVTLATWIFLLDQKGIRVPHPELRSACDALRGGEDADWDRLGQVLVATVQRELKSASPEDVVAWAASLYGADHIAAQLGSSREERLASARTYQFRHGLPWLAVILDRFPNGTVGAHWVMVERVTDTVTCMDPYPWDDVDEEHEAPLVEFLVKWELAGCSALRWVP